MCKHGDEPFNRHLYGITSRYIIIENLKHKGGKLMQSFTVDIRARKKYLVFMMSIFGFSAANGTGLSIFS
jgi:hypothetical protein